MNYYIIWYEDYLNGKLIDRDIVREETTNKIVLYKDRDKAKKRVGVLLIKNPKETAYRAKQGAKATGNAIKNTVTPLDDLVMKSEGRKMNKLQKFLSNFSRYE